MYNKFCIYVLKEPVASTQPRVSVGEDLKSVKGESEKNLTLLCPAQAWPTPVFRY